MSQIYKQIHQHFERAKAPLIVPHQNPDGDALGSAVALAEYFLAQGKKPVIYCPAPVPKKLQFLPSLHLLESDEKIFRRPDFDVVVVLDSGDLSYAGIKHLGLPPGASLVNIDHHPTNELFGQLNLVVPTASATAEILFNFFKHNQVGISRQAATALLAGLIGDTDNFSNGATSPAALSIAGELMLRGASLNLVSGYLVKNKTSNLLKLWGVALSRLTKNERLDLAYTYITAADLAENDVGEAEGEGIANYLNNLSDAKISLILKETRDGKIKGSLRTTHGDTDVSALAKKFGGGGHKKAAGFTTDGTIKEVLNKILTEGK